MHSPIRRGVPTAVLTLALLPLLIACGGEGSSSSAAPAFTRTDSAGVTLAVTTYAEPVPEVGWTIDDASQIRYGESGGDEVLFQWIRNATRLPDGRVVALDGRSSELYVFSATGELKATAGGEGDGPSELKRPSGVQVIGGDTIVVFDTSHRRLSLFDTNGGFLDEERLEAAGSGEDAPRLVVYGMIDAVGDTVTLRSDGYYMSSSTSMDEDYVFESPTLRYATDGTLVDEVAEPMGVRFYKTPDGPRTRLFENMRRIEGRDGLVYIGDWDRYEVRVYQPPQGLIRIERLERPRRPVTDELMEQFRAAVVEQIDDPERRRRILEEFLDKSPVADSMSWVGSLIPDALGNVWVTEFGLPGSDSAAVGVFSAEGEWLGHVRGLPGFRPLEIGADYILGVFTDELDVPHLVSYDLVREPPAMETAAD
ncbi:MAG: 6-bladed beta-propeller [Gemmatimonadales bacterium]|jgi:hypothetical protein